MTQHFDINLPTSIWDALKEAEAYGASLPCVCEEHKTNTNPWVCPRHGIHFTRPVVVEFKDGTKGTIG